MEPYSYSATENLVSKNSMISGEIFKIAWFDFKIKNYLKANQKSFNALFLFYALYTWNQSVRKGGVDEALQPFYFDSIFSIVNFLSIFIQLEFFGI